MYHERCAYVCHGVVVTCKLDYLTRLGHNYFSASEQGCDCTSRVARRLYVASLASVNTSLAIKNLSHHMNRSSHETNPKTLYELVFDADVGGEGDPEKFKS